ncbi:MAG: zinc-ribbon domain-containing protein, partial [Gammaproteobacteria bacterium]|nr:zinc-ribbon domain-containing protein [Gammaproteobacteria bacterium]
MFTQCPQCKTVFEVAPSSLAVAAGTVRCGECSKTFNALRFLASSPLEFIDDALLDPPRDQDPEARPGPGPA